LLVPATPTGTGVVAGPRVTMNWYLKDSSGNEFYDSVDCGILLADAGNNWNMNTQLLPIQFADNAGPAPVGLSQAQADVRYVQLGVLATTGAVGAMRFATNAEAQTGVINSAAVHPAALKAALVNPPLPTIAAMAYSPTIGSGTFGGYSQTVEYVSGGLVAVALTTIVTATSTGLAAYSVSSIPAAYGMLRTQWEVSVSPGGAIVVFSSYNNAIYFTQASGTSYTVTCRMLLKTN
jgi:hypothetical protein